MLIFCKDPTNFEEVMLKLKIKVEDGIDSSWGNIRYYPSAKAYIWPKDDN